MKWSFGLYEGVTSVRLMGYWTVGHGSVLLDVTDEATWESGAPDIAKILEPGHIASVSPGDAQLRVNFRGKTLTPLVRVYAGEPPLLVIGPEQEPSEIHRTLLPFDLFGAVNDRTLSVGPQPGIVGARVEILTGHNAGRSAITDAEAHYHFEPPFICGAATVRATKPGYRDLTESLVFCDRTSTLPFLGMTTSP